MKPLTRTCLLGILAFPGSASAQNRDRATAPPVAAPLTIVEHPSQGELEEGFARRSAHCPDAFTFEFRGKHLEDRPILMGRITDTRLPDEDKQVALLTSAHGAKEMNAVTGLLRGPGVIAEVPIPPGAVKAFHIVSCHYDTPARRPGFTAEDW
jgi:hypothetical protein